MLILPHRRVWPVPGSKTDDKVRELIAAALFADAPSRRDAILAAVAAEREACAEVADGCVWGRSAARKIRQRAVPDLLEP